MNARSIEKSLGLHVNARPTVKFALARPVRRRPKTASYTFVRKEGVR